ncbi:unnamed protein product [Linum tenue]|uniref:LNS2/PITP domain-containing protein n=1 Tax=Linum tenue TaxID=586396 RepID=A0AAV0RL40_9ROSI|nr:unnamed protein product [Linum tenue]
MYAVGRIGSYITKGVSTVSGPFHPFGGAVDIVVVEQADGSFKSSPWYVRFGKFQGVLKAKEKIVSINVNGVDVDFNMYLDQRGEAFFIRDEDEDEDDDSCSMYSNGRHPDRQHGWRQRHAQSLDFDHSSLDSPDFATESNEKFMLRARSGGPRIMGIVFGRRAMKGGGDGFHQGHGHTRVSSLERAEMAADLLEVRWSTSLSPPDPTNDSTNEGNKTTSLSVVNNGESSLAKENSSQQHVYKEAFVDKVSVDNNGQVVETFAQIVLEMPQNVDEYSVTNVGLKGGDVDDVMSEAGNPNSTVSGPGSSKSVSECNKVQSITYCGTSESSFVRSKSSSEETVETICIASGGRDEANLLAKAVDMVSEQLPEVIEIRHGEMVSQETEETKYESGSEKASWDIVSEQQISSHAQLRSCNVFQPSMKSINEPKQPTGCCMTKLVSFPASECSEGEQFHFSDLDELNFRETQFTGNGLNKHGINEPPSSADHFDQENQVIELGNPMGDSTKASTPIDISKVHYIAEQEGDGRLVESLPSACSELEKCDANGIHHPLSHSLESNSISRQKGPGNDDLGCLNVDKNKEGLEQENHHSREANPLVGKRRDTSKSPANAHASWKFWPFSSKKSKLKKTTKLDSKTDNVKPENGSDSKTDMISQNASDSKNDNAKSENCSDSKTDIIMSQNASDSKTENGRSESSSDSNVESKISQKASNDKVDGVMSQNGRPDITSDTDNKSGREGNEVATNVRKKKQLASLNLNEGANVVTFTFSTSMLGKQTVDARIFRWKFDDRIVISDVDGTITKSDVLGQFMPLVGYDWSQTGVTRLFSAIKDNGYKLLFLSARSISQAYHTRQFLFNLTQDGTALPEGPVVISPDGLFPSLYREVIRRAPHEFKISCLEDIKALFPSDHSPFYAGFGNRDTDELSYLKVGIPRGKIFIINPKGEVSVHRRVDTKSYTSLHDLVDEMFPHPVTVKEQEDFNSWNYWRLSPLGSHT